MKSKLEFLTNYKISKEQASKINGGDNCLIPCIMEFKKVDPSNKDHKWMIDTCNAMCKYQ